MASHPEDINLKTRSVSDINGAQTEVSSNVKILLKYFRCMKLILPDTYPIPLLGCNSKFIWNLAATSRGMPVA
jgi:hypothetical protein